MRNNKLAILVSALLVVVAIPAPSVYAWAAVGRWGGGAFYHPAPCYAGVGAAAVAGFALGAVAASRPPVVYAAPQVVVNPAPVYYGSGPVIGSSYNMLPGGATSLVVNGQQYYQAGSTWYRPYFGSNGVYYQVVATP
jgi:hypothetical protein